MKIIITLLSLFIFSVFFENVAKPLRQKDDKVNFTYIKMPEVLPGTNKLTWEGDIAAKILDNAHKFIEDKISESIVTRPKSWNRNFTSRETYEKSVGSNRKHLMHYIGVEDKSEPYINYNQGLKDDYTPVSMQKFSNNDDPEIIAETAKYRIYQVRWPVLNRVYGEGLLLQPKSSPVANIIALPDADQTPEQLAGLSPGIPVKSQFARYLAENGFQVLIPVLINRTSLFTGDKQQTYREWIYRQAFHMGRHIVGYEVMKVMSAVDWFKQSADKDKKIGVAGYCEGGMIAFYSAAIDKRIDAVLVSGYFNSRQQAWDEPIYRNIWGLLTEFGDAELASLIAPRPLVIEHSLIPEIDNKGKLKTPLFKDVQSEFKRIDELVKPGFQSRQLISAKGNEPENFGSEKAMATLTRFLGYESSLPIISNVVPEDKRKSFNPEKRQVLQVKEIEDHIQWLMRDSEYERNRLFLYKIMPEFANRSWSTKSYHPYFAPDHFIQECKEYRKYYWEEILGKFDYPKLPFNPLTRKVYDKERWTGYEVVLDVYSNLFAYGILLIPKDIKPGERRPVVVCQHGLNGLPKDLVEGNTGYNDAAARLADQGFIVYSPFNLYRGGDAFRWLDRKANTIKKTLFSFIIAQHDQTLQWLGTLPCVDSKRIAFYGLSYGGKTAMRVPAVLDGYCLSICSGDFGDWTRKLVDTHNPRSYMNTSEWEMPTFNMGNTFSYAELAYLIFPRPFMVERGHDDTVQPDEWVAYEYAKVRYVYDQFNLGEKTEFEIFNGGHSMRCEGTFKFLHKHLDWP
jgi:dienelactone hydrolase